MFSLRPFFSTHSYGLKSTVTASVRRRCHKFALAAGLLIGLSTVVTAQELPTLNDARSVNDTTVGIVFHFEDYYRRLIDDMSVELAADEPLRIVPIIGKNHVQTIYDMLFMRGVDLGLVHSDVLAYIARFQNYDSVYRLINGVVELYGERVAIIANDAYESLEDLAGQRVNFGYPGKGSDITASLLFNTLGIDVETVRLDLDEALDQVRSNDIAAHIHLLEDPVDALVALGPEDGVRLLALPQSEELLKIYDTGELNNNDFPNLIAAGETVPSLAVAVMIASYNWTPKDQYRYDKLTRFINAFVNNFDKLQSGKHEPIWQSVSLEKDMPGTIRLPAMQALLDEREQLEIEKLAQEKLRKAQELRERREQLVAELTAKINAKLENVEEADQLEELLNELQKAVEQAAGTNDQ